MRLLSSDDPSKRMFEVAALATSAVTGLFAPGMFYIPLTVLALFILWDAGGNLADFAAGLLLVPVFIWTAPVFWVFMVCWGLHVLIM